MKTKILVTNLILGIGHLLLSTEIPFYINHISHDRTIQHFSVVLCHFYIRVPQNLSYILH
jgi:hypothetical protein